MMRRFTASLIAALATVPLLLLGLVSMSRGWRYPDLLPTAFQGDQWAIFGSESDRLLIAGGNSALMALTVALAASLAGFFTSRRVAMQRVPSAWLMLAILPFAISPAVLALSLGYGWLRLGLAGNYAGVLLAQFIFAYAYAVLLLQGVWNQQTVALGELAQAMGASPGQIWWRVRWPLGRGLLGVCLFQTFLMSWFDFALTRLIGGGRVDTLPLMVFDYFGSGDLRLAAVASLVLVLPPLMAVLIRPQWLVPVFVKGGAA